MRLRFYLTAILKAYESSGKMVEDPPGSGFFRKQGSDAIILIAGTHYLGKEFELSDSDTASIGSMVESLIREEEQRINSQTENFFWSIVSHSVLSLPSLP